MTLVATPDTAPPEPLWEWSPKAVTQFFKAAFAQGQKKLFIREGLNAALAEDFELIVPAIARFWVETITGPDLDPRCMTIRLGEEMVEITLTREFLLRACALDEVVPGRVVPQAPAAPPLILPETA